MSFSKTSFGISRHVEGFRFRHAVHLFHAALLASALLAATRSFAMAEFDGHNFNASMYYHAKGMLNEQLNEVHRNKGFEAALHGLCDQQADDGFVKDTLKKSSVHRFAKPRAKETWLQVQDNPARAERGNGGPRSEAPPGCVSKNNGCFLCNFAWQQYWQQYPYEFPLNGEKFLALVNPWPVKPSHFTIASESHMPQQQSSVKVIADLLELSFQLPTKWRCAWNGGNGGGASIERHYHLHICVDENTFPLEAAADAVLPSSGFVPVDDYPLPALIVRSEDRTEIVRTVSLIAKRWAEIVRGAATANLIVRRVDNCFVAYYVPRHSQFSSAPGIDGLIAFLEALGEIVLTSRENAEALKAGRIDYKFLQQVLAAARPPMVDFLFARLANEFGTIDKAP